MIGTILVGLAILVGLSFFSRAATLAPPQHRRGELEGTAARADTARDYEEVKIVAQLAERGATTSPVGDRSCVSWRLEVERFERGTWTSILDHTFVGPLEAIDGAVTVRLRPESEVVVSWPDAPAWTESSPDALLARLETARAPLDRSDRRRWRETLIRAGHRLAIVGTARWQVEAADYRGARRVLELGNRGRLPLLLSARPEHVR